MTPGPRLLGIGFCLGLGSFSPVSFGRDTPLLEQPPEITIDRGSHPHLFQNPCAQQHFSFERVSATQTCTGYIVPEDFILSARYQIQVVSPHWQEQAYKWHTLFGQRDAEVKSLRRDYRRLKRQRLGDNVLWAGAAAAGALIVGGGLVLAVSVRER